MNRIPGAKIFIDEAFHIHTVRCGHASADPAETYVQAACRLGLKRITFTDHGPFPGNPFSGRMRIEELDDYEKELKALRKQYDRRIDICIGLEIEYLPEYRSYYEMLHERFDLLLLGQHHTSMPDGCHLCSGITASCEDGEKCGALGKWWKASAVLAGYTGTDNDGLWGGCSLPGGYRSKNTIVENSCK